MGEAAEARETRPAYGAKKEHVPPGYKRTEVGVIPEEWEVVPILELVSVRSGQVDPRVDSYSAMLLIAPDHIEEGTGRIVQRQTAAAQGARSGKYLFSPKDVIYSKIRPYLRKACIVNERGLCSADMYALSTSACVAPHYLLHTLLDDRFTDFAVSVSARSGIPKINREELAEFRMVVPPLPEQRAIARALSDVDNLISALDKLVEKKRAIKQATMQQLLTGRTRLPGFGGEWRQSSLGKLLEFKNGLNKAKAYFGHGTPIVNYMDVFARRAIRHVDIAGRVSVTAQEQSQFGIRRGDVLFTRTSETVNEVGIAAVIDDVLPGTVFSGFVLRGRPLGNELDLGYCRYCFDAEAVRRQVISKATYTTRALTNGKTLSSVEIDLPPLPEQRAIAAVLSDMDAEIAALERRREKTRLLKQGMMQELLTGRIRLVETADREVAAE